ncbi:MAG: right-handed parallel beta-helix repeat-containing protein [Nitrospirae bacterium]|nr:right-handed parallel beta-helix repeat-containing protein [Nitrospirota bacterium]
MRRLFRKHFSMVETIGLLVVAVLSVTVIGYAVTTVPNTFTSGTTISSSEVNANFQALANAIDTVKPAQRVIVAASGGDYTSISAALAAINPDAKKPYVIEVMPGIYAENVTMKDYVHLKGAGREVTTVQSPSVSSAVIALSNLTHVAISGLTIKGGRYGIHIDETSATISGNTITGNFVGILSSSSSIPPPSPMISENTISGNGFDGIGDDSSSPTIKGNTITGNFNRGISTSGGFFPPPTIMENLISGNNGSGIETNNTRATIMGNFITENAGDGIGNYNVPAGTIGPLDKPAFSTISGNTITRNGGNGISN